jgi:aryl-alcohol dehydrogenase-like predicted oxidoreductase
MEYTKLGRTGLDVSRMCLGCMSYGEGDRGNHAWSLGEEESRPFIKRALEAGINFFDTANRYSIGSSEEILGRAIRDFARRDEVVIATKVYGRMRPGPNGHGLSRKAIMIEIDASDRVAEVAAARGIPRAQVALAWLLAKPVITAPIVGATKLHHLEDALAAVKVKLSTAEIATLEEPYVPHAVVGFV